MALDPKQILQRNIPLVVCYVLTVVPLVLWFVLVASGVEGGSKASYKAESAQLRAKKAQLETISKSITTDPSQVYTPDHLKKLIERNKEIEAQNNKMKDLLRERDTALEKWLPSVGDIGKDKLPPPTDFQSKLTTAIDGLKKEYVDIAIDPSPTKTSYIVFDLVVEGNQKKIQKQFWVVEKILKALKQGGTITPNDPVPVRLLAPIEFGPVVDTHPSGGTGTDKPKPLTAPIPVKLIAQMSMRDVSKVVRELLAQDIVFKLKSLHTELLPFGPITPKDLGSPINADPKPIYELTIYNGTLGLGMNPVDDELIFPEPKLKVTIEIEAVDFDMNNIDPQPAAPAPGNK